MLLALHSLQVLYAVVVDTILSTSSYCIFLTVAEATQSQSPFFETRKREVNNSACYVVLFKSQAQASCAALDLSGSSVFGNVMGRRGGSASQSYSLMSHPKMPGQPRVRSEAKIPLSPSLVLGLNAVSLASSPMEHHRKPEYSTRGWDSGVVESEKEGFF